jgi:DNA-binding NarL/FixJ family response regulator
VLIATHPRLLIVDTEAAAHETVRTLLAPEDFQLRTARCEAEAYAVLEREIIDLVICDVKLPELDGYAVCNAIKSHADWQFVPVILLTASDQPDEIVRGMEAGAEQFVTKPMDGAVLRARARAMIRVRRRYANLRKVIRETHTQLPQHQREQLIERACLTPRERSVLDLVMIGHTHDEIARELGITERTSRFHQANLLAKLGAESRLDLLRLFA